MTPVDILDNACAVPVELLGLDPRNLAFLRAMLDVWCGKQNAKRQCPPPSL